MTAKTYSDKLITADEAAKLVKSGDVVAMPYNQPVTLGFALAKRKQELQNITIQGQCRAPFPWLQPGWDDVFAVQELFAAKHTTRQGIWEKRIDWAPWIPGLSSDASRRRDEPARGSLCLHADVFMCKVTPPNRKGYCSFGHSVWYSLSAIRTAKIAVAEIDPNLIWTYGDRVHVSELSYIVELPKDAAGLPFVGRSAEFVPEDEAGAAEVVGAQVASLIKDGDTLQIGVGAGSEMVCSFLGDKNDLGLDTEMVNVGIIDLVRSGVVTGKRKRRNRGKVVATTAVFAANNPANADALKYLDRNPVFELRDSSYLLHVPRIAAIDNIAAINSALAIDLNGQIAIDHIGPVIYAGIGGQVEYCIGSHYAKGGRSIHALLSTARHGTVSRIVPSLEAGGMTHLSPGYTDFVVTEHGMVNLEGKTRRQRADALISIAHPDFRSELSKAARGLFYA